MSELDIYQDLFSKIQENRDKIKVDGLDLFEVTLYDDDTILETWDLTEQLQEDAIARLEIKNDTRDVHWILHFMDSSVKKVLGEDEVFKKVEQIWETGRKVVNATHSMEAQGTSGVYSGVTIGLGLSFVIIGLLGLYFKITDKYARAAAKFVKGAIEDAAYLIPGIIEDSAYLIPGIIEDSAYLIPVVIEDSAYLKPGVIEDAAYLSPGVIEEAAYLKPWVIEDAAYLKPGVIEDAAYLKPGAMEDAAYLRPGVIEDAAYLIPGVIEDA
ncbi:hypothetical protein ACHWQZ_G019540 [Mnemiopsis leidyi]